MATRKRRRRSKSSKKRRTVKKRTRKTSRKARRSNKIPLKILEKRAGKLVRLVAKRGGTVR